MDHQWQDTKSMLPRKTVHSGTRWISTWLTLSPETANKINLLSNASLGRYYYDRGCFLDNEDKPDEALIITTKRCAETPNMPIAITPGRHLAWEGELDKSIDDFNQVLRLDLTLLCIRQSGRCHGNQG